MWVQSIGCRHMLADDMHGVRQSCLAATGDSAVHLGGDTHLRHCHVAICVDDSASVQMQGGSITTYDHALEAGFFAPENASLALKDVLIRGDLQRLWRSGERPHSLAMASVDVVAGPSRPHDSFFSFSSQGVADLADEECEDVENVMDAKHVPLEDARTFERLAQRALTRV
jgi:hypothetical protein